MMAVAALKDWSFTTLLRNSPVIHAGLRFAILLAQYRSVCDLPPTVVKLALEVLMVYQGTVQNGVVVFPSGLQPPEGSPVRVELINSETPQEQLTAEEDALFRMSELAIETGIPDLAVNINHYLYGHPKVTDGQ